MSYIITRTSDNRFSAFLKTYNGQIILVSNSCLNIYECKNIIQSIRINSIIDARYERLTAKNGKFYFNLKAANHMVIGSSQMYESELGRENGIELVKINAPKSSIVDSIN